MNIPLITAAQLKAGAIALERFLKDEQPNASLDHFQIVFGERDGHFLIIFVPDSGPDEEGLRGGRTMYGLEVHYLIHRDTFEVLRINFAR